jgi:hypothetical protein
MTSHHVRSTEWHPKLSFVEMCFARYSLIETANVVNLSDGILVWDNERKRIELFHR